MSGAAEEGVVFDCAGSPLVGVLHRASGTRGVLVVVGGPQYRAGSHRQFTLLARRLAASGTPVLRFDSRGHGDSGGERPGFHHLAPEIDAACALFRERVPDLEAIAIWGLCDAASAALLHPALPASVSGLVLLNPWVSEQAPAPETLVRRYYLRRALAPEFWRKLLSGGVALRAVGESVSALAGAVARRLRRAPAPEADGSLAARMARGLTAFEGPVLLITSGQDLTAGEFLDVARADRAWRRLLAEPRVTHAHLEDANHTFSTARWRERVETLTAEWLRQW